MQQPLGQLVALHTQAPDTQAWPAAQPIHAAPLVPRCVPVWLAKGTQLVPLQHPDAQLVPSQTHTLLLQRWPLSQSPFSTHSSQVNVAGSQIGVAPIHGT